jgi:2-amino-4-hydroxy-6-hydroxymethyldihydropteridine diphosphokinase
VYRAVRRKPLDDTLFATANENYKVMNKSSSKATSYLSLGSNIGDRLDYLNAAKEKLTSHPGVKLTAESKVYETEPWTESNNAGHPHSESGRQWFLNQVVKIRTSLLPHELLAACEKIEKDLGRKTKHDLAPREIDIDILLYNNEVIDSPELQIPHRHMRDRRFVLEPLTELEPDIKDQVSGKTYKYILDKLEDSREVTPFL